MVEIIDDDAALLENLESVYLVLDILVQVIRLIGCLSKFLLFSAVSCENAYLYGKCIK